ncbi:SGNH/GDSL hydrolase family protein [Pseudomonas sp. YQ_13]|uniref:SGNH/GDSL hydrolase family protein n=1 Tax=Pseudomonas sp. YQ_13 TaxID=3367235 RepID=UPI00370CEA1A
MRYNTGNPVEPSGSSDPRDLHDNAGNIDLASNGDALVWKDRTGKQRVSLAGMESQFASDQQDRADAYAHLLEVSTYELLGEYAAGIVVQSYNQLFRKDGTFYRAGAGLNLPYTTTGTWAVEGPSFVDVGDFYLRQQLALKMVPNARDAGATGTGSGDEAADLNAFVSGAWAGDINAGTYPISVTVPARGKDIQIRGSVRATLPGGDPQLAHDQIIDGILLPQEAFQKFDASYFWKVGPVIAFWGDSNTAFCDASANRVTALGEGSTPANVEMKLREHVYYVEGRVRGDGSPGETAQFGWNGLENAITTFQPQVMVLAWGTNDIAQGFTREQYLDYMRLQIERLLVGGIRPIVQSIPYHGTEANRLKAVAWNSSLKRLCDFYGVRFVTLYNLFANTPSYYFWPDNVHYQMPATRMISQILCDAILDEYGLPRDKFKVNKARRGAIGIDGSFGLSGLRHSLGKPLTVVQTPNQYLRQFYPYSVKIPAGTEVHFQAAGPFSAIFNRPDGPATGYLVNGGSITALTRGNTIAINSIATRFDGSYANFRVSHATSDLYLVATHSSAEFPVDLCYSAAEVSSSQFIPGQVITVTDGAKAIQTVMQDVSLGLKGTAVNSSIPNVGPIATRTAITSAPEGFLFLQTGTVGWWKWIGGAWVAM